VARSDERVRNEPVSTIPTPASPTRQQIRAIVRLVGDDDSRATSLR
jgi:hypothetical protein